MQPFRTTIDKVNNLMKRLKSPVIAGQIRKHTDLYPCTDNVARWSSTSVMISIFRNFKNFLSELDVEGLAELIP